MRVRERVGNLIRRSPTHAPSRPDRGGGAVRADGFEPAAAGEQGLAAQVLEAPKVARPRGSAELGPVQRANALARMQREEFDVLVVGGGATGASAARDAASRGLKVAMIEAGDFASGTSSRSSKLLHGGIRYLEQGDVKLVREALKERGLLKETAPHLFREVSFLFPLEKRVVSRPYIGAGMMLYDLMAGERRLAWHKHYSRKGALELAPCLKKDALVGAITYSDGQVDDARLVLAIARTAAQEGAIVANRVKCSSFLRDGDRVVGAQVRDEESGQEFSVRARTVVNATGVWTSETQAAVKAEHDFKVQASKGIHLVVPRDRIEAKSGMIFRTEKSVLFVIPWGRHWIIGTTDTAWEQDEKDSPVAHGQDVERLLNEVNKVLANPLSRADVEGIYSGLRPLVSADSAETTKISREHQVDTPQPGLVVIAGGKLTTCRVMGQDAVDAAVKGFDEQVAPSRTDAMPLLGADGFLEARAGVQALCERSGLAEERVEHLLQRYGSETEVLVGLIAQRPALGQPIPGADEYLQVEVFFAASHEGALHLEDVLSRRTRISIETFDRGMAAAEPTARVMGEVLGWDEARIGREVQRYAKIVQADHAAEQQHDDESAVEASRRARAE